MVSSRYCSTLIYLLVAITSALPSSSNKTALVDVVQYDIPNTDDFIVVSLGIAVPNTARLNDFLTFVALVMEEYVDTRGHDYSLAEDNDDPFSIGCQMTQIERYFFNAMSPEGHRGTLTWDTARATVRGLQDVIVAQERNRLARDVKIFKRSGRGATEYLGSASLTVEPREASKASVSRSNELISCTNLAQWATQTS